MSKKMVFVALLLSMGLLGGASSRAAAAGSSRRIELTQNWRLISARNLSAGGEVVSMRDYDASGWHAVPHMPATILEILEEDGVYPDLYKGMNLLKSVPQDLYLQDWWYRTTFIAPAGQTAYQLEFPGINYRAELWLNGKMIAGNKQVVGMYAAHELDVTREIKPGEANVLAVKVTPERLIQNKDGVELGDDWLDWINGFKFGYLPPRDPKSPVPFALPITFISDRNAGIWKAVYLRTSGAITVSHAAVNSKLPLPDLTSAQLTVYAQLKNRADHPVSGILQGTISRPGKPTIQMEEPITLAAGEDREARFDPQAFPQLRVDHPAIWWPYTMGKPNLYNLKLEFLVNMQISDVAHIRFGIRTITQGRDKDEQFPDKGKGGNFYLQVNGKDFLVRGAAYTPDLLFKDDPDREATAIRYAKDMGLNMLRWELKISSERIIDLADEEGVPVMLGWMCCGQWEAWDQWNAEDHRVAAESMRSQIEILRSHASVFLWANGSDGLPPAAVRSVYNGILSDLHWQNAAVDTVAAQLYKIDKATGEFHWNSPDQIEWSGIHMLGPYAWRPPTFWMSGRYPAARGACAEQGDIESIPPFESLKKFIPGNQLWPINDTWGLHGGMLNSQMAAIKLALDKRYGPSESAEEFTKKAQLAHYENTRAQFDDFAANGWANHKMTIYWMLDSPWPSFFGHLFDYYAKPGGAYYGAKKGLRPLSVVFDAYAAGDRSQANITVVNQSPEDRKDLRVRVRIYDIDGKLQQDKSASGIAVSSNGARHILSLPRMKDLSAVYFLRCELFDVSGSRLAENIYWQSQKDDDVGEEGSKDLLSIFEAPFVLKQDKWADMTALNTMKPVRFEVTATRLTIGSENHVTIALKNPTKSIAFFERAEIASTSDGDELLPIQYDDNYVTVFPGETVEIRGVVQQSAGPASWVNVEGYNTARQVTPIQPR